MSTITIDVTDKATPFIKRAVGRLTDRTPMNQRVGAVSQAGIRNHLLRISQSRHATAQRLGSSKYTGFLGLAAESVNRQEDLRVSDTGVTIVLNHPGIGRAFGDVRITAGTKTPGAKFLTIPARAEAYGLTYRQALGKYGVTSERTGKQVLPQGPGEARWFLFVPSVLQKQDRTLLPSDEEINQTALGAVKDYLREELEQAGL